jgi:menaquinol-cytochrome c reductase iron-sulfur subunit
MSELLKHPGESSNDDLSPEGKAAAHSRRTFLFKLSVLLNAAVGTVLAVPIAAYLLAPAMKRSANVGGWLTIGSVNDFPVGETRLVDFQSPVAGLGDGQTGKVACWVRHISAQQFQVFAINCAHLGCPVRWFAQSKLFFARAMAALTTKMVPEPRARQNAGSLNTDTSCKVTHCSFTRATCQRWPPRHPARKSH